SGARGARRWRVGRMTSDIAFLEDLREDLLEVAEFDAGRHEVTPRARDRAPLMTRRRLVIFAAATFGVLAGVIGFFATRGGGPFGTNQQVAFPGIVPGLPLNPRIRPAGR